jgi:hypothetical protein
MKKQSLVFLLILYVASTAISYGAFTMMKKGGVNNQGGDNTTANATPEPDSTAEEGRLTIASNTPKDQVCPLNGKKYTKAEADSWQQRRPLAVMIENSPDARPQSGLTKADIVYEAMAEGGVTRFAALFYCDVQAQDTTLAPVRSAREYFWQLISGYNNPLYVHVGGANTPGPADALGHIADAGWNGQQDMNQFSIGYPTFVRDYNRTGKDDLATEHTMVTSTEKLWVVAAKRGWTNLSPVKTTKTTTKKAASPAPTTGADWKDGYTSWDFQDDQPNQGTVSKISFDFWDGFDAYAVRWEYDASTNSYKRFLANEPHIDLNNNQQIQAKNAVILFAEEKGPIDEKKHMLYTVTGTGDALVFQNGAVVKAKWAKKDRESQMTFTDEKGKPVKFVRGLTWISMVSKKTNITY